MVFGLSGWYEAALWWRPHKTARKPSVFLISMGLLGFPGVIRRNIGALILI